MTSQDARNALYELSDRLWWAEQQEWLILEWLMEVLPDDFPSDRRYITAKARENALRMAQREASAMAHNGYTIDKP